MILAFETNGSVCQNCTFIQTFALYEFASGSKSWRHQYDLSFCNNNKLTERKEIKEKEFQFIRNLKFSYQNTLRNRKIQIVLQMSKLKFDLSSWLEVLILNFDLMINEINDLSRHYTPRPPY